MQTLARVLIGTVGIWQVAVALPWLATMLTLAAFGSGTAEGAIVQATLFVVSATAGVGLLVTRARLARLLVSEDSALRLPETRELEAIGFGIVGLYLAASGLANGTAHAIVGAGPRMLAEGIRLALGIAVFAGASRLVRWRRGEAGPRAQST